MYVFYLTLKSYDTADFNDILEALIMSPTNCNHAHRMLHNPPRHTPPAPPPRRPGRQAPLRLRAGVHDPDGAGRGT